MNSKLKYSKHYTNTSEKVKLWNGAKKSQIKKIKIV